MGVIDQIKRDATKNGSKVQTAQDAKLEGILNKTFYLQKDIDEETKFVNMVMTRGLESQERIGLHASAIIDKKDSGFCVRQQVLSLLFKQLQGEQLPVKTMRVFEEGNAVHEKWQRLFIRAGYAKAKTLDKTRIDKEYMLSYTPDIVCRIPEFYKGVMIGEIKSMNSFSFSKQSEHPSGKKQLQFYMYLCQRAKGNLDDKNDLDYKKGFVLMDSKNDQDFRVCVYDYNPEIVAPFIDRLEEIKFHYDKFVNEGIMVPRCKECKKVDCKMAEKCPMKDACYNVGMGRIKIG